jgi:hypothetical protein
MNMRILNNVAVSLVTLFFSGTAYSQDCTLRKNKDGIAVYTCEVKDSKFKSIRVELTLESTTPEKLMNVLLDIENYVQWQYKMVAAKVLERISDHEFIYRTIVDAPWPADNRELIMHMKMEYDTAARTVSINVKNASYDYPVEKGVVRVPFSQANWKVTAESDDLKIIYLLRVDPGGSIPAWVINMGIADGPFHSFNHLKERIRAITP